VNSIGPAASSFARRYPHYATTASVSDDEIPKKKREKLTLLMASMGCTTPGKKQKLRWSRQVVNAPRSITIAVLE